MTGAGARASGGRNSRASGDGKLAREVLLATLVNLEDIIRSVDESGIKCKCKYATGGAV